ncbi:hypothetical protein P4S72_18325 [Vibrio sp. PP-XX7]
MQYDARYQYMLDEGAASHNSLSSTDPSWSLYTSASWQAITTRQNVSSEDQGPAFSVDPYRRLAIGTTLASGTGLAPPYLGGQTRWSADVSTGYQPTSQHLDLTTALTAGWTVVGDDNLGVSLSHQTRDSLR